MDKNNEIARETKKMMTMNKELHLKSDVDRFMRLGRREEED